MFGFDTPPIADTDSLLFDAAKYTAYGFGKDRNNKKQLAEMKRKQIAKRRKRRFLFNRS